MDPRLIELNPRIDEPVAGAEYRSMVGLADHRPAERSITESLAGTRKQVGRWLVGLGTALEGGPAQRSAGAARR